MTNRERQGGSAIGAPRIVMDFLNVTFCTNVVETTCCGGWSHGPSRLPDNATTVTHAYNGDGVLVSDAVTGGTLTRYTQDLAAALPQVLQVSGGTTTTCLYGLDRFAKVREGSACARSTMHSAAR